MITHETSYRVLYADTDQMGYMYYGHFPRLYEMGRTEMIRSLGMRYRDMESKLGIMLPVAEMNIRFLRPANYDDLLRIRTTLRDWPTRFIVFHTEIYNEAGKMLNGGTIKLAFADVKTKRSTQPPDIFLEKIHAYFEEA